MSGKSGECEQLSGKIEIDMNRQKKKNINVGRY